MAFSNMSRAQPNHQVHQFAPDFTMSNTRARSNFPKASSQHRANRQPHLGALQILPLELLHMILSLLDLPALVNFRDVNRATVQAVNFLPAYRPFMSRDGRRVLRDIVVIGQGNQFTCAELSRKMSPKECENHNCTVGINRPQGLGPGLYMFFPTRQQLCFYCIQRISSHLTTFNEFGLQIPRDPRYRKYGSSTDNPSAVVALRFNYPYQTISSSDSCGVIRAFHESHFPGGVFNVYQISKESRSSRQSIWPPWRDHNYSNGRRRLMTRAPGS